jgi:hypothetical protein
MNAAHGGGDPVMVKTARTFGDHLRQFARSVDIVDEQTVDAVRDLIYAYVTNELDAAYFSLACEQQVDDRPGLRTVWSSANQQHTTTIRNAAGDYTSQISVSFDQCKPLWVVDPKGGSLRQADSYVDLWSEVPDLPRYQTPINRDMKTSIIVPLVHWSRVLGVIYLESTAYLEIADVTKDELTLLADAIAILLELRQANRAQITGTRAAVNELSVTLRNTKFPRLTKPQLFVAFSGKADDAVIGVIQQILDEFSDALRVVQWNGIEESGSITLGLIEEIARSRFGICYLSEPAKGAGNEYSDNPNVLFEAGMLHSLTNSPIATPAGWVPIRERRSPEIPFDFASERILLITRSNDGRLAEETFRADLRKRVEALLRIGVGTK